MRHFRMHIFCISCASKLGQSGKLLGLAYGTHRILYTYTLEKNSKHVRSISKETIPWQKLKRFNADYFYIFLSYTSTDGTASRDVMCCLLSLSLIYTANVCRDLQGLCGEIGVRGFQIYGDCMYTRNTCNFWSKSKKSANFLYIHFIKIFQISL